MPGGGAGVRGGVSLYGEVSWVMVTWAPSPCGQNDGQIRQKTLPSCNFVGGKGLIFKGLRT